MGESNKERIENYKLFRSLNAIDREMKDLEHRDSGSEHNRRYEAYSHVLNHRETPCPSERERSDDTSSNRSTPGSRARRSSDRDSVDYVQGSRFKEEHQYDGNDKGDRATADECGSGKGSETSSSTSSSGNRGESGQSDTRGEEDDGSYGYRGPTYFDSDSNSNSNSNPKDDEKEDGGSYDRDDYDDDDDYYNDDDDDDDYDDYDDGDDY